MITLGKQALGRGIVLAALLATLLVMVALFPACTVDDDSAQTADATPPVVSIQALDTENSTWHYSDNVPVVNSSTPSFNGTAFANTVAGNYITSVECKIDEGDWVQAEPIGGAYDSETEHYVFNVATPLANGPHTIYARATDTLELTTEEPDYAVLQFTVEAA
jgi:hypothetical protein